MPGAGERHSTRDKGHEEGGWAYTKAGSSLGHRLKSQASFLFILITRLYK